MPYTWILPVTDRDYYRDVYTAQAEINKKKLNPSYEIGLLKGCLNYKDLNRIENNIQFLAEKLSIQIAESHIWSNNSVPTFSEQTRILSSASAVRADFILKYPEMSEYIETVPEILMNWEDFNQLERLQLFIYEKLSEETHYDETKIAVVRLDENMQKTSDIQYENSIIEARNFIYRNSENFYHVHVGERSQAVPTLNGNMSEITNLYSIDIPEGVTKLPVNAFRSCSGLARVNLPDSLEEFEEQGSSSGLYSYGGTFKDCTSLTEIQLASNLKKVPGETFKGCTGLQSITIPDKVTELGEDSFYGCTSLSSVTIGAGVIHISKNAVYPRNVAIPHHGVFYNCTNLKEINIPEKVQTIGFAAFYNCISLETITIPESVKEIAPWAFAYCEKLANVTILDGVEKIGASAFGLCTSLKQIYLPDTITEIIVDPAVGDTYPLGGTGHIFAKCTSLTTAKLSAGLDEIPQDCFYGCSQLEKLTIPNGVTTIGKEAFYECSQLEKVVIPESVTTIRDSAFRYCDLKRVTLPENITTIGKWSFSHCSNLESISIPDGIRTIGIQSFSYCYSLRKITIPTNIRDLGSVGDLGMFTECESLISINVKNRRYAIKHDPWRAPNFISTEYYDRLVEEEKPIPEGKFVVYWSGADGGDEATLAEMAILKEIDSNGVVISYSISKNFRGIRSILQENPDKTYVVEMGDAFNMEAWEQSNVVPSDCFAGLTNVKSIYIPQRFRTIEENAFSDCTALAFVHIDKPKGEISGEPWGAPAGTVIYYSASLVTNTGDKLTIAKDTTPFAVRTTGNNAEFDTGLSGILLTNTEPEEPVENTLYLLNKSNVFKLELDGKELKL